MDQAKGEEEYGGASRRVTSHPPPSPPRALNLNHFHRQVNSTSLCWFPWARSFAPHWQASILLYNQILQTQSRVHPIAFIHGVMLLVECLDFFSGPPSQIPSTLHALEVASSCKIMSYAVNCFQEACGHTVLITSVCIQTPPQ